MLLQVTPIVVTAPVMTLGTTMTHQFTSTAAPYPGDGHGVAATRMPRLQGAQLPTRQPGLYPGACRQPPVAGPTSGRSGARSITLAGTRCRPSGLSMPRLRMYALRAWRRLRSKGPTVTGQLGGPRSAAHHRPSPIPRPCTPPSWTGRKTRHLAWAQSPMGTGWPGEPARRTPAVSVAARRLVEHLSEEMKPFRDGTCGVGRAGARVPAGR
jgi:hypothetical protein